MNHPKDITTGTSSSIGWKGWSFRACLFPLKEIMSRKSVISSTFLAFSLAGLAVTKPAHAQGECGTATYYDTGEVTSSGELFDPGAYTAASSYIPNGTYVVIQNLDNGLEVTVEVNDYNPGWGIIDVTPAVMEALDPGGEKLSLEVCLYY
jgi:hypothetical protein